MSMLLDDGNHRIGYVIFGVLWVFNIILPWILCDIVLLMTLAFACVRPAIQFAWPEIVRNGPQIRGAFAALIAGRHIA